MARKKFSTLTEPMSYLLMSLRGGKNAASTTPTHRRYTRTPSFW